MVKLGSIYHVAALEKRIAELEARIREADACLEKFGVTWSGHAYIGFARKERDDG